MANDDWLRLAREILIREGVDAVKVDRLAREAGVTRGGFYWRFKSRSDLLDQLLEDWKTSNTEPYLAALSGPGSAHERFSALVNLWLEERAYSPDFDTAVRAWARTSPSVADVVRETDEIRIAALRDVFVLAGYRDDEAFIRARVTYFHQVGYYALGLRETAMDRASLRPLYYKVLFGSPTAADSTSGA
jgi:AcrR family transcriptional regulator